MTTGFGADATRLAGTRMHSRTLTNKYFVIFMSSSFFFTVGKMPVFSRVASIGKGRLRVKDKVARQGMYDIFYLNFELNSERVKSKFSLTGGESPQLVGAKVKIQLIRD